jgi:aconitate hydratase
MMRGTFNHVRLTNKLVLKRVQSFVPTSSPTPATTTLHMPSNIEMDIFDASELYRHTQTTLIVLAGKDYGCGPSRDWVAKGPWMLVSRLISIELNVSNYSI